MKKLYTASITLAFCLLLGIMLIGPSFVDATNSESTNVIESGSIFENASFSATFKQYTYSSGVGTSESTLLTYSDNYNINLYGDEGDDNYIVRFEKYVNQLCSRAMNYNNGQYDLSSPLVTYKFLIYLNLSEEVPAASLKFISNEDFIIVLKNLDDNSISNLSSSSYFNEDTNELSNKVLTAIYTEVKFENNDTSCTLYVKDNNSNYSYSNGYNEGYNDGYQTGNEAGYNSGLEEGTSIGYEEGYEEGSNVGYENGYNDGYESGKEDGINEYLNSSREEGYAAGYQEALKMVNYGIFYKAKLYCEIRRMIDFETLGSIDYADNKEYDYDIYTPEEFKSKYHNTVYFTKYVDEVATILEEREYGSKSEQFRYISFDVRILLDEQILLNNLRLLSNKSVKVFLYDAVTKEYATVYYNEIDDKYSDEEKDTKLVYALGTTCNYGDIANMYITDISGSYSIGFDLGYSNGYTDGHYEGFEEAYSKGQDDGYKTGHEDGYDEGYDVGVIDGYDLGFSECLDSTEKGIYDEGYEQGKIDGYDIGYSDGIIDQDVDSYQFGYDKGYSAATAELTVETDTNNVPYILIIEFVIFGVAILIAVSIVKKLLK